METCPTPPPLRVVLATTGFSAVAGALCSDTVVKTVGIVDCVRAEDNCRRYAAEHNIAHCFFESFEQLAIWLKGLDADLMVVYRMPFLLPESVFSVPRHGAINIHPSLLPSYRGANPWFWIYYNMESHSGVTIHKIDKYEDHGDILLQDSFPVDIGDPLVRLKQRAEKTAVRLLREVLYGWDNIEAVPQPKNEGFKIPEETDYAKLLDIRSVPGIRLWHILRGFPWLLKIICPDIGDMPYKIGGFTEGSASEDTGKIIRGIAGTGLACRDGIISIIM